MRRAGPSEPRSLTYAHDEEALAVLGHAVVGRLENSPSGSVPQAQRLGGRSRPQHAQGELANSTRRTRSNAGLVAPLVKPATFSMTKALGELS